MVESDAIKNLESKFSEIHEWRMIERNKTKSAAEDKKNKAICDALIETLPHYNTENCSENQQRPMDPVTKYSPIANLPKSIGILGLSTSFDRAIFLLENNYPLHAADYLISSKVNPFGGIPETWK